MALATSIANHQVVHHNIAVILIARKYFRLITFCADNIFCRNQRIKRKLLSSHILINDINMLGTLESSAKQHGDESADLGLRFGGKNFTVSVEGNIGSGKSTLLDYYKNSAMVQSLKEPVEQWTNIKGHNAMGLLYQDPRRWSFSFNMYAQLTRIQMHTLPHTKPIKMLERSLYSTRYCFVENNYRNKTINGLEYAVLNEWFQWLTDSHKAHLDLIVYLRADPEVCYARTKKRSRKEEATLPKSLIEELHDLHEEWLIKQTFGPPPAPVLILDANNGYDKMKMLFEDKRQEILCGYS